MDALISALNQLPILAEIAFWVALATIAFGLFTWGIPCLTRNTKTEIDDIIVGILRTPVTVIILAYGTLEMVCRVCPYKFWVDLTQKFFVLVVIWLLAWLGLRVITDIVKRHAQAYAKESETNLDDVLVPLVTGAGPLLVVVAALIVTVGVFSPEFLAELLTVIGALSFLIIFLFQEPLSNLFSGVYLWLGSPFKYGDLITLEDEKIYRVEEIGSRVTRLYNIEDHTVAFFPNSKLAGQRLINQTRPNVELRSRIDVGIAYGTHADDVAKIQTLMANLANAHEHTLGPWDKPSRELKPKKELIAARIRDLRKAGDNEEAARLEREVKRLEVEYCLRDQNQAIWEKLLTLASTVNQLECRGLNPTEREYIRKAAQTISADLGRMRRALTVWVRWSGLLQAIYKLGANEYRPLLFAEIEQSVVTLDEWRTICETMIKVKDRVCRLQEIGKAPLIGSFEPDMEFKTWGPAFISEGCRLARDIDRLAAFQAQDIPWPCPDDHIRSAIAFEDWERLYKTWSRPTQELLGRLDRIEKVKRLRGQQEFQLDDYIEETAQRLKDNFMVKVHGYQYPDVDFVGFGESTLDFSLQFFIDDLVGDHCERLGDVFSEIGTELKTRFDAQHIEIPFPQRDIWVRNMVTTRAETIASLESIL